MSTEHKAQNYALRYLWDQVRSICYSGRIHVPTELPMIPSRTMLYDTYLDLPLTLTHLLFCPNPKYISYTILLLKPLQSAFFVPYTQKLKTHPNTTQPPPPLPTTKSLPKYNIASPIVVSTSPLSPTSVGYLTFPSPGHIYSRFFPPFQIDAFAIRYPPTPTTID